MKPLLPTLKEKKRYIVFEVHSDVKHSYKTVSRAIKKGMQEYLGLLGMSKAGLIMLPKRWNQAKQRGILRVSRQAADHAKAALIVLTKIDNKKALIRSVTVSGTIKKAALAA